MSRSVVLPALRHSPMRHAMQVNKVRQPCGLPSIQHATFVPYNIHYSHSSQKSRCSYTAKARDCRRRSLDKRQRFLPLRWLFHPPERCQICSAPHPASASLSPRRHVSEADRIGLLHVLLFRKSLPHVRRRLDTRHELQRDIRQASQRDQSTRHVMLPAGGN